MIGMMSKTSIMECSLILLCCLSACAASGENDLFQEVQAARNRALGADTRSNPEQAIADYQAALDAMSRFLDQYPDGNHASEVRRMQEETSRELRVLREELAEFQKIQKGEPSLAQPRLPSECEAMAGRWQSYLDRFPSSRFAAQAREKQARWRDRAQEEIKRGFQIIIDEVQVRQLKGPSHQWMAGHPWDPQIFGRSAAPDPFALLVLNNDVVSYTQVARDSFHPIWAQPCEALHVSDSQEVTILIRDRDVAEKAVIGLLGTGLFTFSGIQSARDALKENNDDTIGKWAGTIHELMDQGQSGNLRAGDFDHLKVRVVRPR